MATSGSFTTNSYGSAPYPNRYLLSWSRTSTGSNSSNISWNIKGDGGSGGGYYQVNHGTRVYKNGGLIAQREDDLNLTQGYVLFSSSFTVNHDANGNASFSMSANGDLNTYAQSVSGSGSWSLNRIPLAPTGLTTAVDTIKQTSARLRAEISSHGHGTSSTHTMYYRKGTSGGWTSLGAQGDAAGYNNWTASGLKPNTLYQFYFNSTNNNGDSANSSVASFTTQPASGMLAVMKGLM